MPGIWDQGGIATYIRAISSAQKMAGHEVLFFDTNERKSSRGTDAVAVEYVPSDKDLFEKAERRGLDILHLHSELPGHAIATLPLIRTVHGHQPYCPSGSRYLKRSATACNRNYSAAGCAWGHVVDRCGSIRPRNFIGNFARTWREMRRLTDIPVLAVSRFLKYQMVRSGYSGDLINVLHNPAPDVAEYTPPPPEGHPHFLFFGRISPQKGVDWLLRAISRISANVHVDIVGSGDDEHYTHRLTRELNLTDKVTFYGWLDTNDLATRIAAARAVVFPSVWHEPAGLMSLEAASHGRAVIGSNVGGLTEYLVPGKSALVVQPHSLDGLATAIEKLALDYDLARAMGICGREWVRTQFSIARHAEVLLDYYKLAMERMRVSL